MPTMKVEKDVASGKMTPPAGRSCDWLARHSFGNRSTIKRVCEGREVLLIRDTTSTTAVPTPDGDCEMEMTKITIVIHTGQSCDPRTYEEIVGGIADEEFDKLEAEILAEERRKKEKK
jgi:hypothetical protein